MSDLISRQDAITIPVTPKEDREYQTNNLDDAYEYGWEDLQEMIEQLHTIDAIPIKWILDWNKKNSNDYTFTNSVIPNMLEDWQNELNK